MDEQADLPAADPVTLTGVGWADAAIEEVDPRPHLRSGKPRKYMGRQDDLAVVAAGRAVGSAGLTTGLPGERTGLFVAVGHIPFEEDDLESLRSASLEDGILSMRAFSTRGVASVNPLLAFRCLPNMPLYHVSASLGVRGASFVTYPGAGQFYLALEQAVLALTTGDVDVALLGGVAAQRNFLVAHHHRRLLPPVPPDGLTDAAAFLVLETEGRARGRGAPVRGRLVEWEMRYRPHDPLAETGGEVQSASAPPAGLAAAVERGDPEHRHRVRTRDGIEASSRWVLR